MTGQVQIGIFLFAVLGAFFAFLARDFWPRAGRISLWLVILAVFLLSASAFIGTLENIGNGALHTLRGNTLITAERQPALYWANIIGQLVAEFLFLFFTFAAARKLSSSGRR